MPERIDRKDFLKSTLAACSAVTLWGACSADDDGGNAGAGAAGTGGTTLPGAGGMTGGGTDGGGTDGGGTDGGGMDGGGTDGGGTGALMCSTETSNGDHSHPLTVPPSDVERGGQDAPYLLEDGGTGHTHTLSISAYEFLDLQLAGTVTVPSSTNENHFHECVVTCSRQ